MPKVRINRTKLKSLVHDEIVKAVQQDPTVRQMAQPSGSNEVINALKGGATMPQNYENEPGHGFAAMIRCAALAGGDPTSTLSFAKNMYGEQSKVTSAFKKALAAGDMTAGGFLVPDSFSNEVIELLRPLSVVRAMGPRSVQFPRGQLSIPKITGSATSNYVGENEDIPISEPSFGEIDLSAKKLTTMVIMSNELLKFSPDVAEQEIRNICLEEMSKTEDLNLLTGPGTDSKPLGIKGRVNSSNVLNTNGTTATNIEDDFKDLINALESSDVRFVRPVWIMHPTQKNHLRNLRDSNGNLIFPEIRNTQPTIYGYPVLTSTQVASAANASEVFLVEASQVLFAEVAGVEVVTSANASYLQNGTLASAFSRDQTAIRLVTYHDIALRHDVAAAYLSDVDWGI